MSDLLSVKNLHVAFGSNEAVSDLSFDVPARRTLALVGESGSGKSATALSILRLIEREGGTITGGSIMLNDGDGTVDITALDEQGLQRLRGNRISMVFQEPMTSLNPVLTIGDQMSEVFIRHRNMTKREAYDASRQALDSVRIPEAARRVEQYPHELSGGLRQRVMIAMALACRPKLLIADEPSTALDVTTQAEILDLLRDLQAEIGMAVLFITHDMGVVAEIADRVVVLRHGRKVEDANVETLFAAPKAAYSRQLMAATPKLGSGSPAAPPPRGNILEVSGMTTRFKMRGRMFSGHGATVDAVKNVSLVLGKGETLGLVGESGCGKSTLARSVLRLIEPASGTIALDGNDVTNLGREGLRGLRRHAQMVFQDPYASLNPRLAVHELVTEPARIHNLVSSCDQRELAAELVRSVGLEEDVIDRFAHQFSGGQRQRLCIARAMSVKPKLIVADEPVSALDVSIARQVTDLMLELQQREQVSFLFISHDIAVVERVSQRIAVMYAGEIVETGPAQSILNDPRHPYTRQLLASVPRPDPARRRRLGHANPAAPSAPVPRAGTVLFEAAPGHFVREDAA
ncbi:ABC transporter ATP-binding protein [Oricola cellulosilytica]|uniref:Glutathione import ATP-binding protein GsiA n=1 Tax=Oricola cellulosilytica TaxID=1429082 RepID=A0A4R0P942_9HYPH|nr:ABC transporter ATP-binding protein [Oricola cellulosilytica]TCD13378.1 ABC transporter ATP-binding protein [Oricola cellulosilytica]